VYHFFKLFFILLKRFPNVLPERGFFNGLIELPKDRAHWSITLLFILLAYLLSFWVRLEWIDFAQANYVDESGEVQYLRSDMLRNGVALPNTHDSFYFGSILQKGHLGMHQDNHLIPSVLKNGMITYLPYLLLKFFPSLDIEYLLLWIPVYVAGIVCIPIVLIGRLYGSSLWGLFAACLAGITHSYYNRTLAGYYDTDMFSITVPAFALYFLVSASRRNSFNFAFFAALSLYLYNFFYSSSQAITASLAVTFIAYRILLLVLDIVFGTNKKSLEVFSSESSIFTFKSIVLVGFATYAESWSGGAVIEASDGRFSSGLIILTLLWFVLRGLNLNTDRKKLHLALLKKKLSIDFPLLLLPVLSLLIILFVGIFGGVQGKIFSKLQSYVSAGEGKSSHVSTSKKGYGLHYLDVVSTVREASGIPPDVVRNRILADAPSCSCPRCLPQNEKEEAWIFPTAIIGFLGLFLLILRYWELCLTLPFLAIAYYCFKGAVGLRFTVHVGNVASIGLVFLILVTIWAVFRVIFLKSNLISSSLSHIVKWSTWSFSALVVYFFALPNIQHAKNYNSHVVYPIKTIEVLEKLNEASDPGDFVVTWWDYGSGCWFYGNTRTFTSPAHQTYDNFLTSEILRSSSPARAVNLARLKAQTFVDLQRKREKGEPAFGTAVQAIFKDGTPDLEFYQGLMSDLDNNNSVLPHNSRDIFLFLPYEILRIFPTILSFSSRNLYFPQKYGANNQRANDPPMMILRNGRREGKSFVFDDGYRLDKTGNLRMDGKKGGSIPYGQILSVLADGKPAKPINFIEFNGLKIPSNINPSAARRLLFIEEKNEMVILSPEIFRSTFAQRFLLDRLDLIAYNHPLFEKGPFPRNQPYMAQADWVTQSGQTLSLNMRGGYRIDADLSKNLARIPGMNEPVPFSFHRSIHQPDGKMVKLPSSVIPQARFHLIQTNIPVFVGGRSYQIPKGGKLLNEVAQLHGINPESLILTTGKELTYKFEEFEKIEIPAKGYELRPSSFFMDDEVFNSILIQGFLMENLDSNYFEMIFASSWGKVYKFLK
jgi:dolichyl-diphosphooligosaccharide--protein glycosyltransferase/undecaprenyl-diphosphooligosaccharide--protein glycosyltransferase